MDSVVSILVLVAAGWIVWSLVTPSIQFRITARNGRVRISGPHPPSRHHEIEEFFLSQFSHIRSLRVKVLTATSEVRPRILISGSASVGEQQQIRNFLMSRI